MENTIRVSKIPTIGLAVIIAVIGFTFAACGDGGGGGGAGHVHDWGEWEITPATCIAEGSKTRTCANDPDGSHRETEVIEIDPNGHILDDDTKTIEGEADCENPGEEKGTCIICEEDDVTKIIPALGHDYDYDDDEDGWEIITKANFTTQLKKARICKRNTSHKGEPITGDTLPYFSSVKELGDYLETYDSPTSVAEPYKVYLQTDDITGIRDALGGAAGDKYVYLDLSGSTITTIPALTFGTNTAYTAALVGVTIPDSVITIETGAFWNCTNLTKVTIPDSVITIGGGNSPINGTFRNCTSLTSITIPDSVTSIGAAAFYYCSSLTSITIPDSVTTIESSTFSGCTSLTSVTIGSGVTSIGTNVFNNCTSLTHLTINCNIPANDAFGFQSLTNLTILTIGSSVTSIGSYAFTSGDNLRLVIFEEGSNIPKANFPYDAFAKSDWQSSIAFRYIDEGNKAGAYLSEERRSNGSIVYWFWNYGGKNPTITLPAANVTTLTENAWIDGNLPENSEKLYKFTATTTGTQYIHLYFGTLTRANVAAYDSEGYMMYPGESTNYLATYAYGSYHSVRITSGETYYIRVVPYGGGITSDPFSGSGTYRIAFNTSDTPPAITLPTANVTTLNEGVWENGDLPQYGEKWYKFTATAGTQYIHASFGTLTNLFVQTYNSDGTVLNESYNYVMTQLSGSTTRTNRTVTSGQTYYIRVMPYLPYPGDGYSGTYKIAFNQSWTAPAQ